MKFLNKPFDSTAHKEASYSSALPTAAVLTFLVGLFEALAFGQAVIQVEGQTVIATAPEGQPAPTPPPNQADAKGNKPPKPPSSEKKPGEEVEKDGKPKLAESVKRTAEPAEPPDKRELQVKPDETGRVEFQFRNQAWPDVLRWLAEASSMSLDWQELPGDYLNLATQRPYSIEETRDLINRHLLARGYTMLELEGVLQVAKTEGINTALVPKVSLDELKKLPPNRYVRTSITLKTLVVDDVIDELKMLVSANGKLIPLASTNRLEAMDAAGNLQELYRILNEEQSEEARSNLAKEFPLKHVRATEIKTQLEIFLGIQRPSSSGGGDTGGRSMQMMQEMMQQQQQMMQQAQQQGGKSDAVDKSKKKPEMYLVANTRQNSLIVHAPPDKMAIVEAFLARIDVPNDRADNLQMLQARMQIYRLASLSPKQLVASLLAMDALEPQTQLEVDEANNSIIAHASIADHFTIQKVIERLDGSARKFQMMQLRRLRADEVAGTVKFLMGAEPEKKEDSSRRYWYYDTFSSRSEEKKKTEDKFRVGANIVDNQLLLWCNESEHKEVLNLLVKLGELPAEGVSPDPFRTIDATRSPETLDYLKRLQEKWRAVSPNPLKLPSLEDLKSADEKTVEEKASDDEPKDKPVLQPTAGKESNRKPRFVSEPLTAELKPIEIKFDSDGNLIILSEDLEALDKLESLMLRDAPPKRGYDVFKVEHAPAAWMALKLEDYFKEETKKTESRNNSYFYFDAAPSEQKKDDPQLGTKKQLKFISDTDTGTVVVVGANDSQRQNIKELIELWDHPDPREKKEARYQRLVQIRFSRAEAIEQAIKDVYRDFLSANDKTFDKQSENGKKGEEKQYVGSGNRKFSLGVDKVTNILIVSAEGEDFLNVICELVKQLDEAARPSGSLEVVPFQAGAGSAKSMEKAFKALVEAAKQQPPQNGKQPGQNSQGNNNQNNGQLNGNDQ
jgi:type II secretory pathway component GspD/PulD (secretin)